MQNRSRRHHLVRLPDLFRSPAAPGEHSNLLLCRAGTPVGASLIENEDRIWLPKTSQSPRPGKAASDRQQSPAPLAWPDEKYIFRSGPVQISAETNQCDIYSTETPPLEGRVQKRQLTQVDRSISSQIPAPFVAFRRKKTRLPRAG